MKIRNKLIASATSLALVLTTFSATAFAATDTYANGSYDATIHMYKADQPSSTSMCDAIFDHDAEVKLTDDATIITFYVAYPIPNYPELGTDGTLLDVVATYNDEEYTADLDVTSLTERVFDETNGIFGTVEGTSYPTEAVTITLPAAAIDDIATTSGNGLYLSVYVNAVMNSTQYFYLRLSDLTLSTSTASDDTTDEGSTAKETSEQASTVIGTVEKNTPSYTVTVPSSVALGTLSKEEDTTVAYDVEVAAENFDGQSVEVKAETTGSLVSDSDSSETIAFTNDFGTQTATESKTLSGNINVLAKNVAAAKSGNYTGTTTFVISYFEAE